MRIAILALTVLLTAADVLAQTWRVPPSGERCPSKWGAGDERGSANHMKPESVLRAARLIRTGQVIELGQVLSGSMPPVRGVRR